MTIRVVCFGAGGHARVVLDALSLIGREEPAEIVGLICDTGTSQSVLGFPVLGADADIAAISRRHKATHFVIGVGSVRGGSTLRPQLYSLASSVGLEPLTVVHPSAVVSPCSTIGHGTVIMAGSVIQAGTRIGNNTIVNTRASIDHDCRIGDHVHIAPGVTCSGNVVVGCGAHVGVGATVVEGVTIGEGATVGAGAVVIEDCASGSTIYGVPARVHQSR